MIFSFLLIFETFSRPRGVVALARLRSRTRFSTLGEFEGRDRGLRELEARDRGVAEFEARDFGLAENDRERARENEVLLFLLEVLEDALEFLDLCLVVLLVAEGVS